VSESLGTVVEGRGDDRGGIDLSQGSLMKLKVLVLLMKVGDAVVVAYLSYLRVGFKLVVCAFILSLFIYTFYHSFFNFTGYFLEVNVFKEKFIVHPTYVRGEENEIKTKN